MNTLIAQKLFQRGGNTITSMTIREFHRISAVHKLVGS